MTSETPAQQRDRIIRDSGVSPFMYDSAVALGYRPESFNGMWKIAADEYPILWLTRRWALVHEVVYHQGTTKPVRKGTVSKMRWVLRRASTRR